MDKRVYFSRLIELSLNELTVIKVTKEIDLQISDFKDYVEVLMAYLSGEREKLKKKVNELEETCPGTLVTLLSKLRMQVRCGDIELSLADELLERIKHNPRHDIYTGEVFFVAAQAYAACERYNESKDLFFQAYENLKRLGSQKKANKALLNSIVSENFIVPDKKFNLEYNYIVNRSLAVGDNDMAGIATVNIGKEYDDIGSHQVAIKYYTEALDLMKNDKGTSHYYLTMAYRSKAYFQTKQYKLSSMDYEMAKLAPFKLVKKVLEEIDQLVQSNREFSIQDFIDGKFEGEKLVDVKKLDNNFVKHSNY